MAYMHIMKDHQGFTIYSRDRRGWPYISFYHSLHTGWESKPHWPKWFHGAVYREPMILVGRIYTNKSRWIRLGHYVWPYYLTRGYHKYK